MTTHTAVTAEVATGVARKTILELTAPSTKRVEVSEWWVEFEGISANAEPIKVEVIRKTATITGTGLTPRSKEPGSDCLSTAKHTASGEGTDGDLLYRHYVHPQGGKHVMFPLGDEIKVSKSGLIAIIVTAAVDTGCIAGFAFREE